MCPKIVAAVFDEFDKCNQESCNSKRKLIIQLIQEFFLITYPMDAVD